MDTKKLNQRMALLPARYKNAQGRSRLTEKQQRVIEGYESATKLRAVIRLPQRMVKAGITSSDIAQHLGKRTPRISEYLHFKVEPPQETLQEIEAYIFSKGA